MVMVFTLRNDRRRLPETTACWTAWTAGGGRGEGREEVRRRAIFYLGPSRPAEKFMKELARRLAAHFYPFVR